MQKLRTFFSQLWDFEGQKYLLEGSYFRLIELFALAYTVYFSWEWGFEIQKQVEVILPLGFANYVDIQWWFTNNISLYSAAVISLFATFAFIRIKPQWSYWIVLLLFHFQYAARYSQGEISHGSNFVGTTVFMLAFGFSLFNDIHFIRRFTIGNLFFIFGLGYTSAALCKLIGTGPFWFDGNHLHLWIGERTIDTISTFGSIQYNLLQEVILSNKLLASTILLFGLLSEFFGFLMWYRKSRPFILVVLITMHLGIYWSMNILFDMYIYQLLLLLIPYTWLSTQAFMSSLKHNTVLMKFLNS